jgi:hypothetical protein
VMSRYLPIAFLRPSSSLEIVLGYIRNSIV